MLMHRPQINRKGKSKANEGGGASELDAGDPGNEGSVDRHSCLQSLGEVRDPMPESERERR